MPHGRLANIEHFAHNGATLVDEVIGAIVPRHIVFLHGWGGNRESLRGIGTLFQHTHQVHLLDLPGFGEAPPPSAGWDTINYTDLVQQYVLERLSGPVVLVGHSFGGRISVRLAARRLAQIRGLVLMGVPGLPQPKLSRARLRQLGIRWLRKTLIAAKPLAGQKPIDWHTRTYGSKDYLAAGPLRPVLIRAVNEDLSESAAAVACPTLLLWGTDDAETPPWLGHGYKKLMNGRATLEWLPHKDHHLYTGTGAHLCGYKIRQWADAHADA
ncbi:MAG: alpha/beta fold hydrolase [Luteitalea sp.]|nr:alpha/beta fold hydrolase [Luteitalea sp.]